MGARRGGGVTIGLRSTWSAVVRSEDTVAGDVIPVRLLDGEVAIWRTVAGQLQAWDDRCPHRGTRLTLGSNTGTEVVCRYHGWRFAAGSGHCTFVPAHPTQVPPKNAAVRTYRCVERYGLVWVSTGGGDDLPHLRTLDPAAPSFTMRSITLNADVAGTEQALTDTDRAERLSTAVLAATVPCASDLVSLVYVLCAQDATRTTLHAIVRSDAVGTRRIEILRALNERMKSLQRRMRAGAVAVG
jgi:nitrite reductase/ring-hydroxylating ferredoxin subunit